MPATKTMTSQSHKLPSCVHEVDRELAADEASIAWKDDCDTFANVSKNVVSGCVIDGPFSEDSRVG